MTCIINELGQIEIILSKIFYIVSPEKDVKEVKYINDDLLEIMHNSGVKTFFNLKGNITENKYLAGSIFGDLHLVAVMCANSSYVTIDGTTISGFIGDVYLLNGEYIDEMRNRVPTYKSNLTPTLDMASLLADEIQINISGIIYFIADECTYPFTTNSVNFIDKITLTDDPQYNIQIKNLAGKICDYRLLKSLDGRLALNPKGTHTLIYIFDDNRHYSLTGELTMVKHNIWRIGGLYYNSNMVAIKFE